MIKDFVYSYNQKVLPTPFEIPLATGRTNTNAFIGVETFNGEDYQIDLGDGNIQTKSSSVQPVVYTIPTDVTGTTKIYTKKNNIKTFILFLDLHDYSTSDLLSLSSVRTVYVGAGCDVNIVEIPNNVSSFIAQADSEVSSYSVRRSFLYTPMNRFNLLNTQGTGLTSGEVDDLLEDLSLADWVGDKDVKITGINSARTSSSDSFVTTLEGKGVTVLTN